VINVLNDADTSKCMHASLYARTVCTDLIAKFDRQNAQLVALNRQRDMFVLSAGIKDEMLLPLTVEARVYAAAARYADKKHLLEPAPSLTYNDSCSPAWTEPTDKDSRRVQCSSVRARRSRSPMHAQETRSSLSMCQSNAPCAYDAIYLQQIVLASQTRSALAQLADDARSVKREYVYCTWACV
jgi:hypothetical protein